MLTVGTRVKVIDVELARRTHAYVFLGDKGTVGESVDDDCCDVYIDKDEERMFYSKAPWSIPTKALKRLHEKKVVIPLRD
jgi:hypothetical protein